MFRRKWTIYKMRSWIPKPKKYCHTNTSFWNFLNCHCKADTGRMALRWGGWESWGSPRGRPLLLTTALSQTTDIRSSVPLVPSGIRVKLSFPTAFWAVLKVQWALPVTWRSPLEGKQMTPICKASWGATAPQWNPWDIAFIPVSWPTVLF